MTLYRWCIRPLLFRLDAEQAHHATLAACGALARPALLRAAIAGAFGFEDKRLETHVAGIAFPNPVGLAAGMDKNGVAVPAFAALGFGFVEVGSVSRDFSEGNRVRPRLFRLPADEGLKVFYGVPSDGAEAVAARLAHLPVRIPLGVNLVETNTGVAAPLDRVIEEMAAAARRLRTHASYLTLNLHCPNSADGRSPFDDAGNLARLLAGMAAVEDLPPVFLKMPTAPDPAIIDAILGAADPHPFVQGFAPRSHETRVRSDLKTPAAVLERMPGSMTGPFNRDAVDAVVRAWYARMDRSRYALIGVGGIATAADAYRRIRMGASLVQVATALVYRGPGLARSIKRGLCALLARDGLSCIGDAVGLDAGVK